MIHQRERPRYAAVVGLGFGDCGKGRFIDELTRRWQAHTVVRFNGGAQAGHNVVLPDGRHHTFSQFGAGSFVSGVRTLLASPVVVHPSALLIEAGYLKRAGVDDALQRLIIDVRCRINTPFHQAAGRLRELLRGEAAHGSCGVGFGETVAFGLRYPELGLRYGELFKPALALAKLEHVRRLLLADFQSLDNALLAEPGIAAELGMLQDEGIARRWLSAIQPLLASVTPAGQDTVAAQLARAGTVLFEGAQGALLDEHYGFHPHTTWSTTLAGAACEVLKDAGINSPLMKLGVTRSYLTRHGQGPFPTQTSELDAIAEPHNVDACWQGRFRRGHPDLLLFQYACALNEGLDGLLVSHLDIFGRGGALRPCRRYRLQDGSKIERLEIASAPDLEYQLELTDLLRRSTPESGSGGCWRHHDDCVQELSAVAGCPVLLGAFGATCDITD